VKHLELCLRFCLCAVLVLVSFRLLCVAVDPKPEERVEMLLALIAIVLVTRLTYVVWKEEK
jgi:hypothetical protein